MMMEDIATKYEYRYSYTVFKNEGDGMQDAFVLSRIPFCDVSPASELDA